MINKALKKVFGTRNERELKRLRKIVRKINALEEPLQALDDAALAATRTDLLTTCLLGLHVVLRSGVGAEEVHRYLAALHATVDTW